MVVTYTALSIRVKAYVTKAIIWAVMLLSFIMGVNDVFDVIPLGTPFNNLPAMLVTLALSYAVNAIVGDANELIEWAVERRTAGEKKYTLKCRVNTDGEVVLGHFGGRPQYIFHLPEVAQSIEEKGLTHADIVDTVDKKGRSLRQHVTFSKQSN